jgi:hypothetical protein
MGLYKEISEITGKSEVEVEKFFQKKAREDFPARLDPQGIKTLEQREAILREVFRHYLRTRANAVRP